MATAILVASGAGFVNGGVSMGAEGWPSRYGIENGVVLIDSPCFLRLLVPSYTEDLFAAFFVFLLLTPTYLPILHASEVKYNKQYNAVDE